MKRHLAPPPLLFVLIAIPQLTGELARHMGRKFWPWFIMGMVLPLFSIIILACLRDKSKTEKSGMRMVENDEVFDHLFLENGGNKKTFYKQTSRA